MFAASAASSSRALAGGCRRRLPLHRVTRKRAEPRSINFNFLNSGQQGRCIQTLSSSSPATFSTTPFDGSTFGFNSAYESATSTPHQHQSPISLNPSRAQKITHRNKTIVGDTHQNQQFVQQIQQWTSTNPKIAPYKAEEALARLWVEQQDLFQQGGQLNNPRVAPVVLLTTESVNAVLQAWCFSDKGEVAAERAERLLHWMEDLHSSESSESWSEFLPRPNYQSYATVIDAWSCAAVYESSHPSPSSSNEEVETKSRGRAKSHVISAATKAGFECAKSAEDLLMHMQRCHEQQLLEEQFHQYNSELQPDTRVFNLVLNAWSKIRGGTKASATRAVRILDLMQELHLFQSQTASEWQGIAMSKVQPNLQTYKSILYAWAHANHTVEGPDRAEEILRHCLSMSKAGAEIMLDGECFHVVMKAHAEAVRKRRKGDGGSASVEGAQRVTALLDWMELLAMRGGTKSKLKPTTETYRIALSAWVWSHHVDSPKMAEEILYRMIRVYEAQMAAAATTATAGKGASGLSSEAPKPAVQPDTRDFNTLINCCSFARKVGINRDGEDDESLLQRQLEHQQIFNVAEGALNTLVASSYAQPDSATFSGIIRACVNLLPNTDDRDDKVIGLFRLAYRTAPARDSTPKISSTSSERMRMQAPVGGGCVDANVLRQLRHALPSTEDYIRVREEFEEYRHQNVGDD